MLGERNAALESQSLIQARAIASHEADLTSLSGMVIERERTIRDLTERLEEANACHDRSIASLDAVSARLEELQAQARGQATRIRMKALREAVEVSKRVQELNEVEAARPRTSAGPVADVAAEAASRSRGGRGGRGRASRRTRTATATATRREPDLLGARPLRRQGSPRDRPARRLLAAGRLRGHGRQDSAPPTSRSNASPRAARPSRCASTEPVDLLRELEALSDPRLQGPPHRARQPDPRRRRRRARAPRRLAAARS